MLPSRVTQAFDAIRKGKTFPFMWLATVTPEGDPKVRTMKMCGFNLAERVFYLSTHEQSQKLRELRKNDRAEMCLVDFEMGLQLRFFCRVMIFSGSDSAPDKIATMRERFWQKLSPRSKIELYRGHPQQPKPPESFVLLQMGAERGELLELSGDAPQRFRYPDLKQPEFEERQAL